MKSRPLILVGVLLVLFIGPMSFSNVSAATYEDSSDSITSFSETLESDSMAFFPDGWYDDTIQLVDYGDGDCFDSWLIDGSRWVVFGDQDPWVPQETGVFYTDHMIEGFEYSLYGFGANSDGVIQCFDPDVGDWVNVTTIPSTGEAMVDAWYNGTYKVRGYDPVKMGIRLMCSFDNTSYVAVDYLELRFHYMTSSYGAPNYDYKDSFWNVSDWVIDTGNAVSTDGDVGSLEVSNDSAYDISYTNAPNFPNGASGYYIEFYHRTNVTSGVTFLFQLRTLADGGGATTKSISLVPSTAWTCFKEIINPVGAIESIKWFTKSTVANVKAELDYIRISPSDETGWQHDCATTTGTNASSSDGDKITVTDSITFDIDMTTTPAIIDTSYYPMLDLFVIDGSGNISVEVSEDGSSWSTAVTSTAITDITHYRGNVASLGIDIKEIRVNVSSWATLDYIKLYSIANFSYDDGGGESTNDYSYVASNGSLIVHTDTYTKWNYDPTFSVTIATYGLWSATITNGSEYFRFRELLDTNTLWDQGITNGSLVGTTFEDFDILIYGPCTISSFKFYDQVPDWIEVTNVDVVFFVSAWHIINSIVIIFATEISTYALNLLFLFLGLAMIPASTIFFVKGGRSEMSRDKLLVVTLCFFMGWALFLGGIMS